MTSRAIRAAALLFLVPAVLQAPSGTATAAETCASGRGVRVAPARVRRDAGGGTFYDYDVNGVSLTSADAPASFDPTTASGEALERYGLPPRPDDGTVDDWLRAMRAYRPAGPDADHDLCLRTDLPHQTTCTGLCTNYAGRWATLGNYTAVYGSVVVPNMTTSDNCSEYGHISTWVGIGTEPGSVGLLEAGTITELYPSLNSLVTYGFYEWVSNTGGPTTSPITSSWTADPGDEMYQRVYVNTITHGVNFYVENVTTGQYLTVTAGGLWSDYDPDSAGWIVENHTAQNQANIKTALWTWTGAKVTRYSTTTYGGSTQSPAASTGMELWPSHPSYGEIVESTRAWTSTSSFPAVWYACR